MSAVLTESLEDYLLDIFIESSARRVVRLKDIAKRRGVSLPSVTNAVKTLASKGLVEHENYGYIALTEAGLQEAREIYERHKTIYKFLHNILGIESELAESEAHKMEHDLHKKTIEMLLKFTEFVEKAPVEDKPLWLEHFQYFAETGKFPECKHVKGGEDMSERTLSELKIGDKAEVVRVGATGTLQAKLLDMGVIPGVVLKVEKVAPLGDPIDISLRGYHLSLRKEEASKVVVRRV